MTRPAPHQHSISPPLAANLAAIRRSASLRTPDADVMWRRVEVQLHAPELQITAATLIND